MGPATELQTTPELRVILEPILLRAEQAAAVLAISERTLWQLTNDGEIPCVRIGEKGGGRRYRVEALRAWAAAREGAKLNGEAT